MSSKAAFAIIFAALSDTPALSTARQVQFHTIYTSMSLPKGSFDVRGKPLSQARHWSAPEIFGSRAYFRTISEPAQLVIEDIRRHDEGIYRCRVDFRNVQTRSFRYNLTVIVPPDQPIILDKWGKQLNGTMGPHEEGDDITLTCRTIGGHPQPVVRWLVNGLIVDDQYEHNAGDVIENRLIWPAVGRKTWTPLYMSGGQYGTHRT
ncbi:hypothetical protein NQ317_006271 [Molorchus minor]|uniref:Ig-like domain-containing protein n=1 Tax=Molorchus minor TaxID=1323400 RepID=A0ABQ9IX82_9CUCU|nr:hypothetical protein NQ317_006271 [Molorchus minor]